MSPELVIPSKPSVHKVKSKP